MYGKLNSFTEIQQTTEVAMALDRLIDAVKRTGNPTVAGLDPKLEYLPPSMVSRHLQEYG